MFLDPEVKAIIASIGGDHSCHLLPLLDFDLIAAHPKIFMGYSDITVLNVAIYAQTGLVTFNGPALMTDFAEYPAMLEYTECYFLKAVCSPAPVGRIDPSDWWTEETLDWGTQADLTRPRARYAGHRLDMAQAWPGRRRVDRRMHRIAPTPARHALLA